MKNIEQISERLFQVIESEIEGENAFKKLAEKSEIAWTAWRNVSYGVQKPTNAMLEFCCKEWPEYSVWLMTGTVPKAEVKQIKPRAAIEQSWIEILKTEPETWTDDDLQDVLGSTLAIEVLREVGKIGGELWNLQVDKNTLLGRQKIKIKEKMDEAMGVVKPKAHEVFADFVSEVNNELMPNGMTRAQFMHEAKNALEGKKESRKVPEKVITSKQKKVAAHGHKKD
jgi:hypothetical protein